MLLSLFQITKDKNLCRGAGVALFICLFVFCGVFVLVCLFLTSSLYSRGKCSHPGLSGSTLTLRSRGRRGINGSHRRTVFKLKSKNDLPSSCWNNNKHSNSQQRLKNNFWHFALYLRFGRGSWASKFGDANILRSELVRHSDGTRHLKPAASAGSSLILLLHYTELALMSVLPSTWQHLETVENGNIRSVFAFRGCWSPVVSLSQTAVWITVECTLVLDRGDNALMSW